MEEWEKDEYKKDLEIAELVTQLKAQQAILGKYQLAGVLTGGIPQIQKKARDKISRLRILLYKRVDILKMQNQAAPKRKAITSIYELNEQQIGSLNSEDIKHLETALGTSEKQIKDLKMTLAGKQKEPEFGSFFNFGGGKKQKQEKEPWSRAHKIAAIAALVSLIGLLVTIYINFFKASKPAEVMPTKIQQGDITGSSKISENAVRSPKLVVVKTLKIQQSSGPGSPNISGNNNKVTINIQSPSGNNPYARVDLITSAVIDNTFTNDEFAYESIDNAKKIVTFRLKRRAKFVEIRSTNGAQIAVNNDPVKDGIWYRYSATLFDVIKDEKGIIQDKLIFEPHY